MPASDKQSSLAYAVEWRLWVRFDRKPCGGIESAIPPTADTPATLDPGNVARAGLQLEADAVWEGRRVRVGPGGDIVCPLSHAREIPVTFNRELPKGRAEVPSLTAASVPTAGKHSRHQTIFLLDGPAPKDAVATWGDNHEAPSISASRRPRRRSNVNRQTSDITIDAHA
jgi:hypothetical protein